MNIVPFLEIKTSIKAHVCSLTHTRSCFMRSTHHKRPDWAQSHCQSRDYFCWLYLLTFVELKSFFACSCARKYHIYIDDLYKQSVLLDDACTQFPVFPRAISLKLKSIFRLKKKWLLNLAESALTDRRHFPLFELAGSERVNSFNAILCVLLEK